MCDIIEFLEARLGEDEAESLDALLQDPYPESWANILATRILAECSAKRKIIAQFNQVAWDYEPAPNLKIDWYYAWRSRYRDYMEKFLFAIADPYKDHPDYQEAWAVY